MRRKRRNANGRRAWRNGKVMERKGGKRGKEWKKEREGNKKEEEERK